MYLNGAPKILIEEFLSKLQPIFNWCEKQRSIQIYASSILLVYDADGLMKCEKGMDINADDLKVSATMIDFPHVRRVDQETDSNYLNGVTNLMKILKELKHS